VAGSLREGLLPGSPEPDLPVILTCCDYYVPGYKAGGPIRTIAGLVERLGDQFRFELLTRDRDLGDGSSYTGLPIARWSAVGKARVCYLPPACLSLRALRRAMRAAPHHALYLNSVCSVPFFLRPLILRRLGLVPRRPLIVAPRGELAPGALALRYTVKRIYLILVKLFGLCRGATWHASSPHEASDIRRIFGRQARIVVASDLAPAYSKGPTTRHDKVRGHLRLLFLARISRMKNLNGALRILRAVEGSVVFDIYGPIEDRAYWAKCQKSISTLPVNVKVRYRGMIPPTEVPKVLAEHDLLLLPTLGENFGHVVVEALANGCPVLISDRTRWRNLSTAGVGWDVSLDYPGGFREAIEECCAMENATWREMSQRARRYGIACLSDDEAIDQNRALFRLALVTDKDFRSRV
jgi:glycosyltransferase involved in cell wall biosynthesis